MDFTQKITWEERKLAVFIFNLLSRKYFMEPWKNQVHSFAPRWVESVHVSKFSVLFSDAYTGTCIISRYRTPPYVLVSPCLAHQLSRWHRPVPCPTPRFLFRQISAFARQPRGLCLKDWFVTMARSKSRENSSLPIVRSPLSFVLWHSLHSVFYRTFYRTIKLFNIIIMGIPDGPCRGSMKCKLYQYPRLHAERSIQTNRW